MSATTSGSSRERVRRSVRDDTPPSGTPFSSARHRSGVRRMEETKRKRRGADGHCGTSIASWSVGRRILRELGAGDDVCGTFTASQERLEDLAASRGPVMSDMVVVADTHMIRNDEELGRFIAFLDSLRGNTAV